EFDWLRKSGSQTQPPEHILTAAALRRAGNRAMARLDDLVEQIPDPRLRGEMEAALAELKRRQRFGLVFEDHIPETTALYGLPVQLGSLVQRREDSSARTLYRVTAIARDGQATVEPTD